MIWVFAVQASIGSMVAAWMGWASGSAAFGSALAAMALATCPNLLLLGCLRWMPQGWGPLLLLAGKPTGLLVSVVGLVVLSKAWSDFDWVAGLLNLAVVVVVWLAAPLVLDWVQRRQDDQRIDEIVARQERSDKTNERGAG